MVSACVIGAGISGLCSARRLHEAGHNVVVYEKAGDVGGVWVYTDQVGDNVHSAMYRDLVADFSRQVMTLADFPHDKLEEDYYMTRQEVVNYIGRYADHFNLRNLIRLHTSVELVEPLSTPVPSKWSVTVRNIHTGSTETNIFDVVLVCNGHYAVPYIPEIEGLSSFCGQVLHSHDYRHSEDFASKTVAIVGGSISATEIAMDLKDKTKTVYICARKLYVDWAWPSNVHVCPVIKKCLPDLGENVLLADGTMFHADVILICTGYQYSFPFLGALCNVMVEDNLVFPLYRHLVHADFAGSLAFIGLPSKNVTWWSSDLQARVMCGIIDGRSYLPKAEQMRKEIQDDIRRRISAGVGPRYYHALDEERVQYMCDLAAWAGFDPVPKRLEGLLLMQEQRCLICIDFKKDKYLLVDGEYRLVESPEEEAGGK